MAIQLAPNAMDIKKIKNNRMARKSRASRPVSAFVELYDSTLTALDEISELGASDATKETILKAHVINVVTAVEVYFRDILDAVFRMCKPESFENKLRKIHDRSYKLDDLLAMHVNQVHPLELVADDLSFQNIYNIDKVFSIIIDKPFLKQIKLFEWRLKDGPDDGNKITHTDIENLEDIFQERHLLIHNPSKTLSKSSTEINNKIDSVLGVIVASDLILTNFITDNIDPEVKDAVY